MPGPDLTIESRHDFQPVTVPYMITSPNLLTQEQEQHITAALNGARTLIAEGQRDEGIAILSELAALSFDHAGLRYQLAGAFQEVGQWDDALAQYRHLARIHPSHVVYANMVFARTQKANDILDRLS